MSDEAISRRRAVMYLRLGSVHPDDAAAVALQREACQRIANKHGLAVVREYVDVGRPAHLDRQPALQQLLDDLAVQCDIRAVVVWDYARLARDMRQLEEVIGRVRACGAEVVTMTGVEVAERFIRQQELRALFMGIVERGRSTPGEQEQEER
ncbi:recombinase family protein [Saccharothrix sp. 6-C]|uniref:recombinase family protein n=1 Tax=Saccharothrix sp. 6-C TaxID=2781735 RepID=UPI0019178521|nr:recombinase family protein [Saccharothrix sp. 6-C]